MTGDLSDEELGRRLSAGRGYCRESLRAFAKRIGVERHDLGVWEKGDFGSSSRPRNSDRKRQDAISRVRQGSGLPEEFFVIDFNDLPNMLNAWKQVSRLPDPARLQDAVDEILKRGPKPK